MSAPAIRSHGAVPRVVLYSCGRTTRTALEAALESTELELVHCPLADALIEQVMRRHPEVVIYELQGDLSSNLAVLQLLKRAAPEVRLVLITGEGSLETERVLRALRPVYYAVHPVDPDEILDAVRAALGQRDRPGH